MDISQDSITRIYQSSDKFWNRVEVSFNNEKKDCWENRTQRSLQARIQKIEKAAKKFHACIRAIENRHQSGASHENIIQQAKMLMMEDPKYKSGWNFDHVWDLIKDFEKFKDCSNNSRRSSFGHVYSESENPSLQGQASPDISCSPLNLSDDCNITSDSPSERPLGVKKTKLKRKKDDSNSTIANMLQENNKHLIAELQKSNVQLQQHLEKSHALKEKSHAFKETREENKILYRDLSTVQDPQVRALLQAEKERIIQKRAQQQDPLESISGDAFGGYFGNLGGSGSGLPDY